MPNLNNTKFPFLDIQLFFSHLRHLFYTIKIQLKALLAEHCRHNWPLIDNIERIVHKVIEYKKILEANLAITLCYSTICLKPTHLSGGGNRLAISLQVHGFSLINYVFYHISSVSKGVANCNNLLTLLNFLHFG